MKKTFPATFLIVLLAGVFGFVDAVPVGASENSTNVNGIIDSDITWTEDNSPYIFTGSVGVASGVTLTIEPNVTVNLGDYSLQVDGTLYARGRSGDYNIIFISKTPTYGNIAFTNGSASEQTGLSSLIENAILYSTSISANNVTMRINNNTIMGSINIDHEAAPVISNNLITGDIGVHRSSPKIDNNSIIGGINIGGDWPVISNNIIEGGGVSRIGIKFERLYVVNISSNVIYGCSIGISGQGGAIIEKNLIIDNDIGIEGRAVMANNTIARNSVGIKIRESYPIIISNNIQDNRQNSIYLENVPNDVDATGNWWGTVDTQLINMSIHDRKSEPKLGVVNIVPILLSPVLYAPTTDYTPITHPSLASPDQTKAQPTTQIGILEIAVAVIILSVIINISLVIVVARLLRKKH